MTVRVSDYIADYLERSGIEVAFLLAGGGMMHLLDAVGRRKKLRYVCNHHEHSAAVAAEGYAKKKGLLGVCYATSGPGATNTVTGVAECWQDSVPVLFLSGQSKVSQTIQGSGLHGLRQFGTFEVDIVPIVRSITKYAVFLDDPKMVRYHLEKACALAVSGRPGPVFIDVPVDIQGALIEPEKLRGFEGLSAELPRLQDAVIDGALDRLQRAKRPLILAGHGVRVSGSAERFAALIAKLNVPVVTTQLAADLLEYENPLYVGHPGMKGDRPGNFAVQNADVLLTLGCSLHVLTTGYILDQFAPQAYKIQVELDGHVLKREQVGVHEKIQCGVTEFIDALSKKVQSRSRGQAWIAEGPWHERCRLWKRELSIRSEPHAHPGGRLNFYDLNDALSDFCREGDTVVSDAGTAFYVTGQAFRVKKSQRLITSGAMGAMGHAVPLAIGAATADPTARVVCVTGDGSLQTSIHELATVAHHRLNVALFVVNNGGYVSIRNTQKGFFGGFLVGASEESGVTLPSLEKIAAAYQLPYLSAKDSSGLRAAVSKALASQGPVICEVFTSTDQEILPAVQSYKREDGTMESKPLHDMYPFMDADTLKRYMMQDEEPASTRP